MWVMSMYFRAEPWFADSTRLVVGLEGLRAGFWIKVPNWRNDFSVRGIGLMWMLGEDIEGGISVVGFEIWETASDVEMEDENMKLK